MFYSQFRATLVRWERLRCKRMGVNVCGSAAHCHGKWLTSHRISVRYMVVGGSFFQHAPILFTDFSQRVSLFCVSRVLKIVHVDCVSSGHCCVCCGCGHIARLLLHYITFTYTMLLFRSYNVFVQLFVIVISFKTIIRYHI